MPGGGSTTPVRYDLAWPAVVSQVVDATHFVANSLASFINGTLVGYSVWVLYKANGTVTAPKTEAPKPISGFIGVGGSGVAGTVTHAAFTSPLAPGDMVLLLNPATAAAFAPGPGLAATLFQMDFWSAYQEELPITGAQVTQALPNVVVAGLPTGAVVVRATAFFKARIMENTNVAANKLLGAQNIEVQNAGAPGYATGIALIDDLFTIAAGPLREPGDVLMGNTDLAAVVTGNGTYNFRWTLAQADVANLNFNDVQVGIRVWYSV
jgi:hypothetical protein